MSFDLTRRLSAEAIGTFFLRPGALAASVGVYIGAAIWFTASTSFANPAVTIGRSLSNTFAGIQPNDAPGFLAAELLGAAAAAYLFGWLFAEQVAEGSRLPRGPRKGGRSRRRAQ